MPPYDVTQFQPPAPLARVTLRNPDTGALSLDVLMWLESCADVSLIPRVTLDQLEIISVQDRQYELIGFDGSRSFAPVVQLELIFCH